MNKGKIMMVLVVIIIGIIGVMLNRGKEENIEVIANNDLKNETKIVLYFSNEENGELSKEYRIVDMENIKNDMPTTIINELLKGPQTPDLTNSIPEGTKLNKIEQEGGKIIVDFSNEFGETSSDELAELHKIYSVVNSLTEITEVNEVEIRIDGKTVTNKIRL